MSIVISRKHRWDRDAQVMVEESHVVASPAQEAYIAETGARVAEHRYLNEHATYMLAEVEPRKPVWVDADGQVVGHPKADYPFCHSPFECTAAGRCCNQERYGRSCCD